MRTILVTGGSRGIGRAIVYSLAERGNAIAFTYHRERHAAMDVCRDLCGRGLKVSAYAYDLADSDSAEAMISAVRSDHRSIQALVANAGIWMGGRIDEIDRSDWRGVIDTNLVGTYDTVRAALPAFEVDSRSSICLVSSVVGVVGFPGDTAYASAKAGLIGLVKALAKELWVRGIRVNALAPGFIETDMTAAVGENSRKCIATDIVMGRFGTPEEAAAGAVYLTEDATYTTGALLTVDGGWSL